MRVTLAQMPVSADVAANTEKILAVIGQAAPGDYVVFPEGAISGYFPEQPTFTARLDAGRIDRSIDAIQERADRQQCHCLVGSAIRRAGVWRNAAIVLSPAQPSMEYYKVELSRLDRQHFTPGDAARACDIGGVPAGVQVCRELMFAGSWLSLRQQGALVMFHVNNAIKPQDTIWRHLLVARAVELGVFVCSVNNAAPPQQLASMLIDPAGRLLIDLPVQVEQTASHTLDLTAVARDLAERTDF